jgi:hypothetical protein
MQCRAFGAAAGAARAKGRPKEAQRCRDAGPRSCDAATAFAGQSGSRLLSPAHEPCAYSALAAAAALRSSLLHLDGGAGASAAAVVGFLLHDALQHFARHLEEGLLNVDVVLGAGFEKFHFVFVGEGLATRRVDDLLCVESAG